MKRYFSFILCVLIGVLARSQGLVYWFDTQPERYTTAYTNSNTQVDVSPLPNGVHTLYAQMVDTAGRLTPPCSTIFTKFNNETINLDKVLYWFDSQSQQYTSSLNGKSTQIDVASLSQGVHTLYAQLGNDAGQLSTPFSTIFVKFPPSESQTFDKLLYWFDAQPQRNETTFNGQGTQIDVASVSYGVHTLYAQLGNDAGQLSTPVSTIFVKFPAQEDLSIENLLYWFDHQSSGVYSQPYSDSLVTIDTHNLSAGVHVLYTCFQLKNQQLVPSQSTVFLIVSANESKPAYMHSFSYVVNDSAKTYQRIYADLQSESWHYVSLLKMPKMPIRSSNFKFEIRENNQAYIYAVNDVLFTFWDTKLYSHDTIISYVDYNVSEHIQQFIPLVSDVRNIQNTPKSNQILWYSFTLQAGDSVQLYANNACTMQVFSPTAQPVFESKDKQSKTTRGFHAYETGTFYMALHDAAVGSRTTTSVDFKRIDRYAVLRQDVRTMGNGGCTTIHYDGNGFNELKSVDYVLGLDTLHAIYIGHESNSQTSIVVDASGARLGTYTAIFHFAEENRVSKKNITIQESKPIDLVYSQPQRNQFTSGKTYYFEMSITNKGNSTAYAVPIVLHTETSTSTGIRSITLNGFGQAKLSDYLRLGESLSAQERQQILKAASELDDSHALMGYKAPGTNTTDSTYHRQGVFYVDLLPNEQRNIAVKIVANNDLDVTLVGPTTVPTVSTHPERLSADQQSERSARQSAYCGYKDRVECVTTMLSDVTAVAGMVNTLWPFAEPYSVAVDIAGCAMDVINLTVLGVNKMMCGPDAQEPPANIWELMAKASRDGIFATSVVGSVYSCIGTILPITKFSQYAETFSNIGCAFSAEAFLCNIGDDITACIEAFKSNNDVVIEKHAKAVAPSDPNDIYGYKAASGSRYVGDTTEVLNYTIEFENDPKFATAPAQTVVITDSLDLDKFDISTLATSKVQIGYSTLQVDNEHQFTYTLDMRPYLEVIAQIEQKVDSTNGVVTWTISSLDPLTLDLVTDPMIGALPVNQNGNGIGTITYTIHRKQGLKDGSTISNKAWIVFDQENPIVTPVWTNTLDLIYPTSQIMEAYTYNDSVFFVFDGQDSRSGIWYYMLFGREDENKLWNNVEDHIDNNEFFYGLNQNIYRQFMVLSVDSAGNVELEKTESEFILDDPSVSTGNQLPSVNSETGKFIDKGHLYIRHKDRLYNASGAVVKRGKKQLKQ